MKAKKTNWQETRVRSRGVGGSAPQSEVQTGATRHTEWRPSDNAVSELVSQLGQAAREGWGPSVRWLLFLIVGAGVLAALIALCPLAVVVILGR